MVNVSGVAESSSAPLIALVFPACRCCDNWLYLAFIHRPDVHRWLGENGLHLLSPAWEKPIDYN